jgi:peptidoglycan/LPS O-acetylase OafA/YrhL
MKVGNTADNVLWSLRWEIIFSLLLPVFVLAAVLIRRSWIAFALAMAGCVALTIGDPQHANGAFYLPVFMMGTLLASRLETIQRWGARRSKGFWIATLSTSLFFMVADQVFLFAVPANSIGGGLLWSLVGAGAAGVILCAIGFEPLRRFLDAKVSQFLGRISFSLYLIHVPIIATLAFARGDAQWWLVGLIGIPLSLGSATLFHRFVEVPSQRLARHLGARAAGRKPAPRDVDAGATTIPVEEAPQPEYARAGAVPRFSSMR